MSVSAADICRRRCDIHVDSNVACREILHCIHDSSQPPTQAGLSAFGTEIRCLTATADAAAIAMRVAGNQPRLGDSPTWPLQVSTDRAITVV